MNKISSKNKIFINPKELWKSKDLLYFLILKDIKSRYAQSIIGVGWAIIQPVFFMIVFTIIFGKLAKIESEGVPYQIFSFCALVPWTFFSNSITDITNSLISNINMVTKIYIPRFLLPISAMCGKSIDFIISLIILVIMLLWFNIIPGKNILLIFYYFTLLLISSLGIGTLLTTLAIQYRDVKYALPFGIQLLMYCSPVVYSTSIIPEPYRVIYALNPIVIIIEGFRYIFLDAGVLNFEMLISGTISIFVIFLISIIYFVRTERTFADVV
ncbi:MAG: phosphate ABC transporter permease [Chloroflexi bacterium]|nr:phosphate ABC transporter permease [Chloroflexota bacterium]|tara:strand:- start:2048 stop:2857 length:810 start_codon:yes stop_codon:yes gene_type:complete